MCNCHDSTDISPHSNHYKKALPVIEDMTNTCKTQVQFDSILDLLRQQRFKNIAENGSLPHHGTTT